jgi:hypothetical protein
LNEWVSTQQDNTEREEKASPQYAGGTLGISLRKRLK